MPDRFSNGDPSNDRIPGMRDQSLSRDKDSFFAGMAAICRHNESPSITFKALV